jgi:hypothetical protein
MLNPSAASAWCSLKFLYRREVMLSTGFTTDPTIIYLFLLFRGGLCSCQLCKKTIWTYKKLVLSGWYQRAFGEKTSMILTTTSTKITTFHRSFEEFSCFERRLMQGSSWMILIYVSITVASCRGVVGLSISVTVISVEIPVP